MFREFCALDMYSDEGVTFPHHSGVLKSTQDKQLASQGRNFKVFTGFEIGRSQARYGHEEENIPAMLGIDAR